ncbi:MAG: metalloregulator ArsR/SmtB family transcription factor, partial [Betaproteobacteria bacterium]
METAALLRLLGDPTRLRLLRLLSRESLNVSELTAVLGVAQSGVSRHLGLLRDAGLVTEERSGLFAWYRLSDRFGLGAAGAARVAH